MVNVLYNLRYYKSFRHSKLNSIIIDYFIKNRNLNDHLWNYILLSLPDTPESIQDFALKCMKYDNFKPLSALVSNMNVFKSTSKSILLGVTTPEATELRNQLNVQLFMTMNYPERDPYEAGKTLSFLKSEGWISLKDLNAYLKQMMDLKQISGESWAHFLVSLIDHHGIQSRNVYDILKQMATKQSLDAQGWIYLIQNMYTNDKIHPQLSLKMILKSIQKSNAFHGHEWITLLSEVSAHLNHHEVYELMSSLVTLGNLEPDSWIPLLSIYSRQHEFSIKKLQSLVHALQPRLLVHHYAEIAHHFRVKFH